MVEADAPGKLVICGEYAVLAGAPAIAVAVDVRARAQVIRTAGPCHFEVAGAGSWSFAWDARGLPCWPDRPDGGRGLVLDALAATLAEAGLALHQGVSIRLDTQAFHAPGGGKLGLGSSAAITAALAAALCAAVGRPLATGTLFELARLAHRRLQGGNGSGIDVAAAVHGGIVGLVPGQEVEVLGWPAGLHWLAAWSGYGAATPPLLARFNAYRRRSGAAGEALVGQLCQAAQAALRAWQGGEAAAVLAALARYRDALAALDAGARIGIVTRAHRRLAALAADAGCLYKTSGAGGGDFGLVLAADAAAIGQATRALAGAGVMVLAGGRGAPGLLLR
ncbi:MAG: hypothetical protein IT484_00630 [Gammaproteobacteria bacterium]|nr:hypothetical protein [Gammaproteobacteria bacterium]